MYVLLDRRCLELISLVRLFFFFQLRQVFGLYGQTTGKGKVPRAELHGRPLELFMCSVLKRQGYGEGFRWIAQYLD